MFLSATSQRVYCDYCSFTVHTSSSAGSIAQLIIESVGRIEVLAPMKWVQSRFEIELHRLMGENDGETQTMD